MKPNLIDAIYKLYPQVTTTLNDIAYDADGNEVAYDKSAVQAYVDAHAYIAKRAAEYPSFADQFDTLYHGGYDAWKAKIDSVKAKYPKP
jgi:rhodanese-related sulfurtransferase